MLLKLINLCEPMGAPLLWVPMDQYFAYEQETGGCTWEHAAHDHCGISANVEPLVGRDLFRIKQMGKLMFFCFFFFLQCRSGQGGCLGVCRVVLARCSRTPR